MSFLRHPTPLEERHFVEVVTHFRDRQKQTGKKLSRELRAELRRFGYLAVSGGLQVITEVMDDQEEAPVDDDAVNEYLALLKRIGVESENFRVDESGGDTV